MDYLRFWYGSLNEAFGKNLKLGIHENSQNWASLLILSCNLSQLCASLHLLFTFPLEMSMLCRFYVVSWLHVLCFLCRFAEVQQPTKSGEVQISVGAQSTKWQTQNPKWTCSQSLYFLQVPLQIIRLRHESSILGRILKSLTFRVGLGEQKFKQNHYCYQCHNREMMQQLDQRKDRFIPDSPLLSLEESNIAVE